MTTLSSSKLREPGRAHVTQMQVARRGGGETAAEAICFVKVDSGEPFISWGL